MPSYLEITAFIFISIKKIISLHPKASSISIDMNSKESRFDQMRRLVGAVMGPLCAVLLWIMPIQGIEEPAHHLLAVECK